MSPFLVSHIMLVLAFIAGLLTLGRLLRQRRSPQSALAWIGFAILLPYVAVPLFFLFGRRKLHPRTPIRQALIPHSDSALQDLIESFGIAPARTGNRLRLCTTGQDAHAALVDLIDNARDSLQIEIFILHPDAEGMDVLERLARRASEGVSVRLLLDGVGSLTTWPWTLRKLKRAGAEIAFFQPLWRPGEWPRANLRNHRKIVIADAKSVLAGGINIANEYLGAEPDPTRWTDLAFLAEGPVVEDYQRILDADWSYATGRRASERSLSREATGGACLQVVPSGPDVSEDVMQAALLQAIYTARERIWMVTPYFVPGAEILKALTIAARRGVEVRLILPEASNHRLADWARGPYVREVEREGGHVRLFQGGMLHAKAVLIDRDLAMLGSANLDLRSLYLDFEVLLLVYDPQCVADVETWMKALDVRTTEGHLIVSRVQEIFEGAVRLLAPLL